MGSTLYFFNIKYVFSNLDIGLRPGMTTPGDGFIKGVSLFASVAAACRQRQRATQDNNYKL